MPARKSNRSWKLLRIYFRRFRMGVWLTLLALLGTLLYLNQIGLPGFVKNPLLEKLRLRGLDLQFARLRLRFPHGLVADEVHIGGTNNLTSPALTLKEVQVRLDYAALLAGQVQVNSLLLRQGRLVWPVNESHQPPRGLTVENIQTRLQFLPGDLWQLDQFTARFAGAKIELLGTITNASAIRDWKIFQPGHSAAPGSSLSENLRRLADALDRVHFSSAPQLRLEIFGDARDLPGFGARITLQASGAETPWGNFERVAFMMRANPPEHQEAARSEIILRAANAHTPWAGAENVELSLHVLSDAGTNFNADLNFTADRIETRWGNGHSARFTAQWQHASTNAVPLSGRGELSVADADSPWGRGTGLHMTATLATPAGSGRLDTSAWGWWKNIAPYALELDCRLDTFASTQFQATNLVCVADWRTPGLQVKRLSANLYEGTVQGTADLNVSTREMDFTGAADGNVQKLPVLAPPSGPSWLADLILGKPPQFDISGHLLLPEWTNQTPQWSDQVRSNAQLAGQVSVTNIFFRGVPFTAAGFHFSCTNQVWRIPDLRVTRREGALESAFQYDERGEDYSCRLNSRLDVAALHPFLTAGQWRGFALAGFTDPPEIVAEFRGNRQRPEGFDLKAHVALTNFTFRGETASGFQSALTFTNQVISLHEPRLERGEEHVSAELVRVDLAAGRVFLTNVLGFANPLVFARAIGPVAGAWFEPYRFLGTPVARVNGSIAFDIADGVDLHFDFEGGPFAWWRFQLPHVAGQVNWVNHSLTLKNIHADFYQGRAQGEAEFYFPPHADNQLRFELAVTNADLHFLLNDVSPPTNGLKGLLTGTWSVTGGIPDVGETWQGTGRVNLREGLIMAIPVFGVLSPALETLAPGLGTSRLSEGTATFVMTNGIIHSDDVDIRASGMRLQYRGNVDLQGRVEARAEAELFRDTWVVGRVLSLVLWPVSKVLEYRVSGPLGDPKMEPLFFVPRLILMPLHTIEMMKEPRSKAPFLPETNAPPEIK